MLTTVIALVIASIVCFYIGRYIGKVAKFDPKNATAIGKKIFSLEFNCETLIFLLIFVGIKYPVVFFAIPVLIGIIGFTYGRYKTVSGHPDVHIYY